MQAGHGSITGTFSVIRGIGFCTGKDRGAGDVLHRDDETTKANGEMPCYRADATIETEWRGSRRPKGANPLTVPRSALSAPAPNGNLTTRAAARHETARSAKR